MATDRANRDVTDFAAGPALPVRILSPRSPVDCRHSIDRDRDRRMHISAALSSDTG